MKHIFKNLSTLLFLIIGIPLFITISCSNDSNSMKSIIGDKGNDGIGCNFYEDWEYYVMVCNEEEKARWAKAYCGTIPYNPAEMKCSIYGILSFYFIDERDSKTYKALIVGNQTWMAENLNYATEGSKCYANDPANCNEYGRLYDWGMAKKVCPDGWHLPDREDWNELIFAVGNEKTTGTILKTKSGWNENGSSGTDELGFAALPCGLYSDGDFFSINDIGLLSYLKDFYSNGDFFGFDDYGFWWSATEFENDKSKAYLRTIAYDKASFDMALGNKTNLLSVRCVKD
jgi:uncharacterized protein (TIGR02145 family)